MVFILECSRELRNPVPGIGNARIRLLPLANNKFLGSSEAKVKEQMVNGTLLTINADS